MYTSTATVETPDFIDNRSNAAAELVLPNRFAKILIFPTHSIILTTHAYNNSY